MWLALGAAAQVDKGFYIAAGAAVVLDRQTYPNIANRLEVICAAAAKKFTCSDDV